MDWNYGVIALFVLGFVAIYIIMWIFIKPVKIVLRLILNSVAGALALIIFNYVGSLWGISLGVNIFTAAVCGILGIPGFVLLLIIKWLYGI